MTLRRTLWSLGMRYRLNTRVVGRPDLLFPRQRLAVFLDGCFWHGCPQHYIAPTENFTFWVEKLRRNVTRDFGVTRLLLESGWTPFRIWQHELPDLNRVVDRISRALAGEAENSEPTFLPGPIWWQCPCGSIDVQVLAVSTPGSLKPKGRKRPGSAEVICRACHRKSHLSPFKLSVGEPRPAPGMCQTLDGLSSPACPD
jgi:DNA mismatch endonuclease (patch repair protein)